MLLWLTAKGSDPGVMICGCDGSVSAAPRFALIKHRRASIIIAPGLMGKYRDEGNIKEILQGQRKIKIQSLRDAGVGRQRDGEMRSHVLEYPKSAMMTSEADMRVFRE